MPTFEITTRKYGGDRAVIVVTGDYLVTGLSEPAYVIVRRHGPRPTTWTGRLAAAILRGLYDDVVAYVPSSEVLSVVEVPEPQPEPPAATRLPDSPDGPERPYNDILADRLYDLAVARGGRITCQGGDTAFKVLEQDSRFVETTSPDPMVRAFRLILDPDPDPTEDPVP